MDLTLTTDEAELLHSTLGSAISDMSPEIADTDNPSYRAMLRQQRDVLSTIQDRLAELRTSA